MGFTPLKRNHREGAEKTVVPHGSWENAEGGSHLPTGYCPPLMAYLRLTIVANRVPFVFHFLTRDPLLLLIQAECPAQRRLHPGKGPDAEAAWLHFANLELGNRSWWESWAGSSQPSMRDK